MTRRVSIEWVYEGRYAAEVHVESDDGDAPWSPTLSFNDARKIERVWDALRRGDVTTAAQDGKVYEMMPLAG